MCCTKPMYPVTEHFILKSNVDPAQEDACNLELKGKTLGEVGEEDCKVWLRAETKVKKGRRRRKKGSRGKENYKPSSSRACTTTNNRRMVRWCYSAILVQCCAFFLKQPAKKKALHIYNLDLFWKVCSLKKILSNCRPSAPASSVCEVMSTPTTFTNM